MVDPKFPFLVDPYSTLASVYDRAGFADFSRTMIPRYVSYAQSIDWAGRSVLDLGCGTGFTSLWLADQGYRVGAVDRNPHMLKIARNRTRGPALEAPEYAESDIRQLESPIGLADLAVAVGGVFNAILSLRELDASFGHINHALEPGKLFIFDMVTIRGLAVGLGNCDTVQYDDGHGLMVLVRNSFSFETLSNTRHVMIHQRDGTMWHRRDEIHTERGYPTQGLVAVLERTGFELIDVLTTDMQPINIQDDSHERLVIAVRKPV